MPQGKNQRYLNFFSETDNISTYLIHFISVWNLFRLDFSSGPLTLQYSWSICKLGYQNFFCTIFGLTEQDVLYIFLTKCWLHIFFPVVNVFYRILCDITLFCIKFRDFCGRHVCNVFAYSSSSITIAARIQLYFAQQFTMHFQISDLLRQLLVLRPQKCSCSSQWAAKHC